MNDINRQIEIRSAALASDLTALILQAAKSAAGKNKKGAPAAVVAKSKRGRPASVATVRTRGRRSAAQIATVVATVLRYIKAHPKSRSESVRKALNMPRPVMRDALDRLTVEKKIKIKGVKRGATYSAA